MRPAALIPSTTALATLSGDGRMRGILAGANVVMPNLSPPDERSKYNLYDGKAPSVPKLPKDWPLWSGSSTKSAATSRGAGEIIKNSL